MSITDYQLTRELGRGAFGVTFLADDRLNGRQVAVKTIDMTKLGSTPEQIQRQRQLIANEVAILKEVSSPGSKYVAKYYNAFEADFNGVPTIFIVSEYVQGSTLTAYINAEGGNLAVSILWPLIAQLIMGLEYIHEQGVAHRDIKPDNILISDNLTIKYIDFGLSCLEQCKRQAEAEPGTIAFEKVCRNNCTGTPGTVLYMPPEFFNKTRVDSLESAQAHDVWSVVLVMYEMANGLQRFPFDVLNPNRTAFLTVDEIKQAILRAPTYHSNYTLDDGRTNAFINSSVVPNWRQRPKAVDLEIKMFSDIFGRPWTGLL